MSDLEIENVHALRRELARNRRSCSWRGRFPSSRKLPHGSRPYQAPSHKNTSAQRQKYNYIKTKIQLDKDKNTTTHKKKQLHKDKNTTTHKKYNCTKTKIQLHKEKMEALHSQNSASRTSTGRVSPSFNVCFQTKNSEWQFANYPKSFGFLCLRYIYHVITWPVFLIVWVSHSCTRFSFLFQFLGAKGLQN